MVMHNRYAETRGWVRDSVLRRAGDQLERPNLGAALGLSEVADAIIIIVSEETGMLSVARNGKLQQHADPKDLEAMLYQLYRSKAEKTLLRKSPRADAPPPAQPPRAQDKA